MSMPEYQVRMKTFEWIVRAGAALSMVVCLSGTARARQEEQQGPQEQQQQQGQQSAQEPKTKPVYPSQDADKPPYSNDRRGRSASKGRDPAAQTPAEGQMNTAGQVPQSSLGARGVPETLMVPAGT